MLWLSHHPNLISKWGEARFLTRLLRKADNIRSNISLSHLMEQNKRQYFNNLPKIPGGTSGVGKYWTFEKSPTYIVSKRVRIYKSLLQMFIKCICDVIGGRTC